MATKENEKILTLERYLELKEQGFEFEGQSYLFWEYMRILKDLQRINPDIKFLLENVKMKKEWEQVLTTAIGVPGVHINSALVSAQNRKRIYWTNIGQIAQPQDRGLLLRDVLQEEVDGKYFLKDEVVKNLIAHRERNKAEGNGFGAVFQKDDEKSHSVNVGSKGMYDLIEDPICVAMRGRDPENPSNRTTGAPTEQRLEPCTTEGKTNCLTTVSKDNLLLTPEPRIRRLTPTECARLQTVPDWYKWQCSETQQYKMLGNGWTIEVIKHIFSYL